MKLKNIINIPSMEVVKGYDHCCSGVCCSGCISEGKNEIIKELSEIEIPTLDEKEVVAFYHQWREKEDKRQMLTFNPLNFIKALCTRFATPALKISAFRLHELIGEKLRISNSIRSEKISSDTITHLQNYLSGAILSTFAPPVQVDVKALKDVIDMSVLERNGAISEEDKLIIATSVADYLNRKER